MNSREHSTTENISTGIHRPSVSEAKLQKIIAGISMLVSSLCLSTDQQTKTIIDSPQEYRSQEAPTTQLEKEIDDLITNAETGISRLAQNLEPQIAAMEDPVIRDLLRIPFSVMAGNRENPDKNYARKARKDPAETWQFESTHPAYFHFNLDKEPSPLARGRIVGSFNEPTRTLTLADKIEADHNVQMLYLCYMLVMARQDEIFRNKFQGTDQLKKYWKSYLALAKSKIRSINLQNTAEAFAVQIEMANLLSGGRLKALSSKQTYMDDPEFMQLHMKIGAKPEEAGLLHSIVIMAYYYYTSKQGQYGIPKEFLDHIKRKYQNNGFVVFEINDQGTRSVIQ